MTRLTRSNPRSSRALIIALLLPLLTVSGDATAAATAVPTPFQLPSITDTSVQWPTLSEVARVILLRDYNTRLVVLSTSILGLAAGLVGAFLLLRKRALIGDTLSHAMLPGIALAFMVMVALGGTGKFLPGLLIGGAIFGLLGVGCVMGIKELTRQGHPISVLLRSAPIVSNGGVLVAVRLTVGGRM